ncbi:MAG: DUF3108 domain-containing protein [Bacteroidales bacterium]|nr:DUF3108 domain-containing protein [Bacteroidales bacterium]
MNRILIVAMSLIVSVAAQAQKLITADRNTGHIAYGAGEQLTYVMRYGFIVGGKANFTVQDTIMDGVKANHVVCNGFTTGLPDMIFKVRDTYESYIDPNTQLPIKAVRNISEGRYRYYDEILYDRELDKVYTLKKGTEDVPAKILDVVSAFYHARNNTFDDNLEIGDTIRYVTYFAGQVYPLLIKYRGREAVSTRVGKVMCHKFSPITEVGRSFKTEDDMQVWISCDGNRIPIKIKFDLVVGSFVCELTQYSGIKYPLEKMS